MRTFDRLLHSTFKSISNGEGVGVDFLAHLDGLGEDEKKALINQCDGSGSSLIAHALTYNNPHWIKFLVEQGAEMKSQSLSGDNFLRLFDHLSTQRPTAKLSSIIHLLNDRQWMDLCSEWSKPKYGSAEILSPVMDAHEWDGFVKFLWNNPGRHMVFINIMGYSFLSSCISEQSFYMLEDLCDQLAWPIEVMIEDRKSNVFSIFNNTSRHHPLTPIREHPRWKNDFWNQGWFDRLAERPAAQKQLNLWDEADQSFLYFAIYTWESPDFVQKILNLGCDIHRYSNAHRDTLFNVLNKSYADTPHRQCLLECLSVISSWDDRNQLSEALAEVSERDENNQMTKNRKM